MSGWMDNKSRMGGKTGEWMVEGWVAQGQAGHLPHVASLSDRGGDYKDDDQQDSDSSRQKVVLDLATLEPEREAVVSQPPSLPPGGHLARASCGLWHGGVRPQARGCEPRSSSGPRTAPAVRVLGLWSGVCPWCTPTTTVPISRTAALPPAWLAAEHQAGRIRTHYPGSQP